MLGLRTAKVGKAATFHPHARSRAPLRAASRRQPPAAARGGRQPVTTQLLKEDGEGSMVSTNRGITGVNSFKRLKSVNWLLAASLPVADAFEPFDGVLSRLVLWASAPRCWPRPCWAGSPCACCRPLVRLRDTLLSLRASGSALPPCRCSSATRSAS
jgi:hypothetical protein